MENDQICGVCHRQPARRNNAVCECSHVECPARPKAWCGGTPVRYIHYSYSHPLDPLFDSYTTEPNP